MTKPLPRPQVFRLTADELKQVETLIVRLNGELEQRGASAFREDSQLLVVGNVVPLVLNEVASRFQLAGYLVETIPTLRGSSAMLRLK